LTGHLYYFADENWLLKAFCISLPGEMYYCHFAWVDKCVLSDHCCTTPIAACSTSETVSGKF
jgi:hypothetical protein